MSPSRLRSPDERARERPVLAALLVMVAALAAGCGARQPASAIPRSLLLETRPIGEGAAFHPPPVGSVVGACTAQLGARYPAHLEVFAANRVVIVAAGIGALAPLRFSAGRLIGARCYGALVTLDATGVALVRRNARLSVADLFRAWGQPLTRSRLGPFRARTGSSVVAFVDGRPWPGAPGAIPLTSHAEIVLEVGPHIPPHSSYTFAPGR
jgi:hypothetical protein